MAEQISRRGDAVTASRFTGPFENHPLRFGIHGLNLKDSLDVLEGWARHTNLDHDDTGEVTARPGLIAGATAGTKHHSMRKLRDPQNSTLTRVWGIDTNLYSGASGALSLIDNGYSGEILSLVPHRPPLSGDPWMFVGDRNKMRKVRADGLDLPIGNPAPSAACMATLGIEYRRPLATFSAVDATDAAQWTAVPGVDASGHLVESMTIVDDTSIPTGAADIYVVATPGSSIDSAYNSWIGIALARDGNTLAPQSGPAGTVPADDNDILHVWLKTSHPQLLKELRIYFVVSATFSASVIPGTDASGGFANTDAYLKTFRQNDFVQYIQAAQAQIEAAEAARVFALRDADLKARGIVDDRASWAVRRAVSDPRRATSLQIGAGVHEWFELGAVGLALRRGDCQRIGNSAGRDWSTITGIIIYIKADIDPVNGPGPIAFGIGDLYLTGGFGPDTLEPGAQQYDYRSTHYDPRTGCEGNGSPEMTTANKIDSLRRRVTVTTAAHSDGGMRQRYYRRGGSLFNDWFFLGVNTANGGSFDDILSDDSISAAGTLPIDHFEPVPTVNDAGTTILAQPCPALFGPIEGMLLACGDPYRPGHLYWSTADQPDHWSATGNVEVCPPSEELMHGGVYGHQGFVFSRTTLYLVYPNLTGAAGILTAASLCKRGLSLARAAFCVGPGGIYFAAEDGFFRTSGGPEDWIGREIQPLFEGKTVNGLLPINKAASGVISVTSWENKVYFSYQDTGGAMQTLVYSILNKFWRHYTWGRSPARLQGEDEDLLVLLGASTGTSYSHDGESDDGVAITCTIRSGAQSGGTREEKLFGDQVIDCDRAGVTLSVRSFLNEETVTNLAQDLTAGSGRSRYILDAFGESPQIGRSISTEVSWAATAGRPVLYQLATAITLQPDLTNRRVTNWDDLNSSDEVYLTGVTFDCDTGGIARIVLIERDFQGAKDTVATLTVQCTGRHKVKYSWPAVPANQVRVHPESEACHFWLLYRADWIYVSEPPRIARWDIHYENKWDQYHTGLDLYCDTFGLEKRIRISVDNVFLTNDLAGGLTYWPVVADGRKVVHLTLPWGRGHVYHFEAVDDNAGLLYEHRWHLDPEPTEQANWIQNFSIMGSRADKWLKAVIFECDTFGQNKAVTIEADGVVVETITVNATGRKVIQRALATEQLGRVWRMFPVDGNPGRLYSAQPVFDEEPFCLDRWETQETNHGLPGWFYPLWAHIVLKSAADVTLTTVMSANQTGRLVTETYVIPATGSVKQRRFLPGFKAGKGVLIKYLLTSPTAFWLYRDETVVLIQPWGASQPITVKPFGNSGEDPTRNMVSSFFAAQASGGSADNTR